MKHLLRSAMCIIPLILMCVSCARNTGSEGGGILPDLGMNSAVDESYVQDAGKRIRFAYPEKSHVAAKVVQWGAPIYNAIIDIRLTRNGQPVPLAHIEFSRSISGRELVYASEGGTLHDGTAQVAIVRDAYASASGYYVARATDANTHELLGTWGSIPINEGRITELELPIGEQVQAASRVLTDRVTEPSFELVPHNAGDRIVVPGAAGVLIASFDIVFAHDVLQYPLRHIVIQDDFDGAYALGDVFSNMRIEMEGKQLGYTFGTLHTGETVSDEYGMGYVYDGLAIVGQKGDIRTINVYADVRTSVSIEAMDDVFADVDGVVEPYMISGRGNHQFDVYPDGPMLRVGIMQHGSFEVTLDAEDGLPTLQYVRAGDTYTAGTYRVNVGFGEGLSFTSFSPVLSTSLSTPAQTVVRSVLSSKFNATVLDATVPAQQSTSGIIVSLNPGTTVPQRGSATFVLQHVLNESVPIGTSVTTSLYGQYASDGVAHDLIAARGETSASVVTAGSFGADRDSFLKTRAVVVAAAGEVLLFPRIALDHYFAVTRGDDVSGFSASLIEGARIEITFSNPPPEDIRMVFEDRNQEFLILVADRIEGTTAHFSFDWDFHSGTQWELITLGVEDRNYGFLSFYGKGRAGKIATLQDTTIRSFKVAAQ